MNDDIFMTQEECAEMNNLIKGANSRVDQFAETVQWEIEDEIKRLRKKEKYIIVSFGSEIKEPIKGTLYDMSDYSDGEIIKKMKELNTRNEIWQFYAYNIFAREFARVKYIF